MFESDFLVVEFISTLDAFIKMEIEHKVLLNCFASFLKFVVR